jgi:hypothetical protein
MHNGGKGRGGAVDPVLVIRNHRGGGGDPPSSHTRDLWANPEAKAGSPPPRAQTEWFYFKNTKLLPGKKKTKKKLSMSRGLWAAAQRPPARRPAAARQQLAD